MSQDPAIHLKKQIGWVCKLGEADSLGTPKVESNGVSQVDGIWDMAPAC